MGAQAFGAQSLPVEPARERRFRLKNRCQSWARTARRGAAAVPPETPSRPSATGGEHIAEGARNGAACSKSYFQKLFADPNGTPALVRRLLVEQAAGQWRRYALAFGLMVVAAGSTALGAYLIGDVINAAYVDKNLHGIFVLALRDRGDLHGQGAGDLWAGAARSRASATASSPTTSARCSPRCCSTTSASSPIATAPSSWRGSPPAPPPPARCSTS